MYRLRVRSFTRTLFFTDAGRVALAAGIPFVVLIFLLCQRLPDLAASVVDAAPETNAPVSKIKLNWDITVQGLEDASFSPDGLFIGLADKHGNIRCLDAEGKPRWSLKIPEARRVQIGPGGDFAVAYSLLNPVRSELRFIDKTGHICWDTKVKGALWSLAVSPDEPKFAIGTGDGYIYMYLLGEKKRRYARWKPDGVPTSLAFMRGSKNLMVGTWQDSSVGCYKPDGDAEWVKPGESDKLYFIQTDSTFESVLSLAVPNRRLPHSVLALSDSTGSTLWQKDVEGEEVKALISPVGRYVAVGFLSYLEHKGKRIPERHVVLYNENSKLLWDKGGMFFKPRLIGMSSSNTVIVYDETFIYIIDRQGKVSAKEKLPAEPRKWWSDQRGSRLLMLCSDGKLYYYTVK